MMKIFNSDRHTGHSFSQSSLGSGEDGPQVESPCRVDSILKALESEKWAEVLPPFDFGLEPILQVHTPTYLDYLEHAYSDWKNLSPTPGIAFVPYKPGFHPGSVQYDQVPDQDGFFMTDMAVPVNAHTYPAAIASAHCALSAAQNVVSQKGTAFGICRPPGHHAGKEICGGFCYLNNAAIAAEWLSRLGKVCILDIDYHAGNGTQSIFYERPDVLTISLHADPAWEYPSFAGFANETGSGKGSGFHHNFPLPRRTDDALYQATLTQTLGLIVRYSPSYLLVSAGFDTFQGDPVGGFDLTRAGFGRIGQMIASLQIPTIILLEGGYLIEELGNNVVALLRPFVS